LRNALKGVAITKRHLLYTGFKAKPNKRII